ncbi:MAG: flagellar protein FlaI [Alphaproteobacteria bacterium HGW-Alphaproteobacteria-13]|nr:MAG: flagellar protein FlaI [Alphaproteobacteria bacterium HGW-Alphaproteobacteria-13]
MSAFGRRPGTAGRPAFGVAKPMQAGPGASGGAQFPPVDSAPLPAMDSGPSLGGPEMEAMERLNQRSTAEAMEPEKAQGFEASVHKIKEQVLPRLLERVDPEAAATLSKDELTEEFRPIILEVLAELRITLNRREQFALEKVLVDELLGFGPLEELLADPDISDIMVNGPYQTYVERKGQLVVAPIQFRDEQHLFQIAQRICSQVGRRVDQTTPLADARLKDGSRVNVIVPPLSLRGTAISIRKFSAKPITLDMLCQWGAMSQKMCTALKIAGASRFNIVISGGTGSGKTTMLNALSKMIDPGERVLTIEDAAELRLQQPHWLPLETRPANLEGNGAIHMGDLVKNALRMRPDRIIMGEVRGAECFDLLAAMNTGHDGSMCTLHSNSPRECLGRMENMVLMGDIKIPKEAISKQIADSVDLIVQIKRLRDGSRRVTNVTEVIGMEGDVIVTQELFKFEYLDEDKDGKIVGEYRSMGLRPYTLEKARQFGFDQPYLEACL